MRSQKKIRIVVDVLLTLIGIILVIYGIDKGNIGIYAILSVLGAAILGATIPTIIGTYLSDDIGDLKGYLLSANGFVSEPNAAKTCAGYWYFYHTSKQKGKKRWLYDEFLLDYDYEIGTLKSSSIIKKEDKSLKSYKMDAGVRSDRLIIIQRPEEGSESHTIAIIKGASIEHYDIRCGIMLHQTWDGSTAISPCLLSRTPLKDHKGLILENDSSFFNIESNKQLDKIWENESKAQNLEVLLSEN